MEIVRKCEPRIQEMRLPAYGTHWNSLVYMCVYKNDFFELFCLTHYKFEFKIK